MGDGLGEVLRRGAGDPGDEVDVADVRRRVRNRRRRRRAAGGVGVLLLMGLVGLGGLVLLGDSSGPQVMLTGPEDRDGPQQTFERPEDGEVEPITAPDGEPAFLVGESGNVRALRALAPGDLGTEELVVWCEPAEVFLAPWMGSEWNAAGKYLGGPAPGDLVPYDTDVDGDTVTVGAAAPAPDRTEDSSRPEAAESALHACLGEREPDRAPLVDPETVVAHLHPERGEWPPVEDALADADKPQTLQVQLAVATGDGETYRACSQPDGRPPQCPEDAPRVEGLDPLGDDLRWLVYEGYAVIETDGRDLTDLAYWVAVPYLDAGEEVRYRRERERERARAELGPADRVTVDDGRITVPADDLIFGDPPDQPVPAGTYELVLENHGSAHHSLWNRELDVDLEATTSGTDLSDSTTVRLEPGTYTFFCRIPGHREHGMEFDLLVGNPDRP